METILNVLSGILLGLGCLVALTGALGILRMPDFYARLHPAGKTDSLAQVLIMAGLLLQTVANRYDYGVGVRLVLIAAFVLLTSPISTHAITKAAHLGGLPPWREGDRPDA